MTTAIVLARRRWSWRRGIDTILLCVPLHVDMLITMRAIQSSVGTEWRSLMWRLSPERSSGWFF